MKAIRPIYGTIMLFKPNQVSLISDSVTII